MQIVETVDFIGIIGERITVSFDAMVSANVRKENPGGGWEPSIPVFAELVVTACNAFKVAGEIGVYSGIEALITSAQTVSLECTSSSISISIVSG
jgi:hypothetical protein